MLMGLLGGICIGVAASIAFIEMGKVAGLSGIVDGVLQGEPSEHDWRVRFLFGLFVGGMLIGLFHPELVHSNDARSSFFPIAGGLLVGFGSRMGNGCTSGHGVCGLSRRSRRSIVATGVFMMTGILTASLLGLGGVS